jgi:hypothetical protein
MNDISTLESVQKTPAAGAGIHSSSASNQASTGNSLTAEEQRQVDELKKTDAEVKAHEQAHKQAGGRWVRGGANYEYTIGPDGKRYAVGGEVSIDTSKEKEPQETIDKMEIVRRAALAPAKPSAQDRSVASKASQIEAEARIEMSRSESALKSGTESAQPGTAASPGYNPAGQASPIPFQPAQPGINLFA